MPYTCCVVNCNGNTKRGPKVHMVSFPNDTGRIQQWVSVIPRKDFTHSKSSTMRLPLVIILIYVLQCLVLGRTVVKRNCNSCCSGCTTDCSICSSKCQPSNCNNCKESSSDCQPDPPPVLVPFPPAHISKPSSISSNNTNNNHYNFTADITLTNTINTVNNISIPIRINNTNENKVIVYPNTGNDRCCIVAYPRVCNTTGCYVRRQRECSSICTSEIVVIPVSTPTLCPTPPSCPWPIPTPKPCPQRNYNQPIFESVQSNPYRLHPQQYQHQFYPYSSYQSCQFVEQYPFYRCRNQGVNCLGCYFCNGMFNPQQCVFSPECPLPCRARA